MPTIEILSTATSSGTMRQSTISMQETYVADDPMQSGFADPKDQERFITQGRGLARRIKREVGSTIVVEYAGDGSIPIELIQ